MEIQGVPLRSIIVDPNGCSAIEAFSEIESKGISVGCREPEILQEVLRAKAYLNLMIKMWAEGIAEKTFEIDEFKCGYPWMKEWVWTAVEKQVCKLATNMSDTSLTDQRGGMKSDSSSISIVEA